MSDVTDLIERKRQADRLLNQRLIEKVKNELGSYTNGGDWLRFDHCPCGDSNPKNPAFAVHGRDATYKCFFCDKSGHISSHFENGVSHQVIQIPTISHHDKRQMSQEDLAKIEIANKVYDRAKEVNTRDSLTGKYLQNRGINFDTWADLDVTFREYIDTKENCPVFVYPFINEKQEIVALQRTFIDEEKIVRLKRKYLGAKGKGIALLKQSKNLIVAEGLETGLSVRQHLGNHYGLIVTGDADGMKNLIDVNRWSLNPGSNVIIAADNDIDDTGVKAARAVFYKYSGKSLIFLPSRPGQDWNDVLRFGKMGEEWL